MTRFWVDVLFCCFVAFILVIIVITFKFKASGEYITTQQYYSQSLQYLEDIRNSNDIIQANCAL